MGTKKLEGTQIKMCSLPLSEETRVKLQYLAPLFGKKTNTDTIRDMIDRVYDYATCNKKIF